MRKSIIMGLGLALAVAGTAVAQQGETPRRDRGEQGARGMRGEGRAQGLLFKDITLTDAQKTQIAELQKASREQMQSSRQAMGKQMQEARAARDRGDTTTARAIMERNRAAMQQHQVQRVAAIRNILTAEQQTQFDKNVTEMRQRGADRAHQMGQRPNGAGNGEHGKHGKAKAGKHAKPGQRGA